MKMGLVVTRRAVPFLQRDREILGRAGERAGVRFRAAAAEEQPAEAGAGSGRQVGDDGDADLRAVRVGLVLRDLCGGALEAAVARLPVRGWHGRPGHRCGCRLRCRQRIGGQDADGRDQSRYRGSAATYEIFGMSW
jgi:hypothetical protein